MGRELWFSFLMCHSRKTEKTGPADLVQQADRGLHLREVLLESLSPAN